MKKLVYGVGVNDATYRVSAKINGFKFKCQYYSVWCDMLKRCYSEKYKKANPTYRECLVCEEWLTFSNFKSWMESQNWNFKEIDKDILSKGNKIYGPDYCVFVDSVTNSFLIDCGARRGNYPIGVSFDARRGLYRSQCRNPLIKKCEHLGYFDFEADAHKAWKSRKHEIACRLADLQTDERVANALRTRYI